MSAKNPAAKAPWKKPVPKTASHTKLTEAQKQEAKTRAAKAGRPYPNLVDNMAVAKKAKAKKTTTKKPEKKSATKKPTAKKKA